MTEKEKAGFYPTEVCPFCGQGIQWRERGRDGSSGCVNDHIFKSSEALTLRPYRKKEEGPFTHEIKCWPEYFQAKLDGRKKFEYRVNDRQNKYKEGDHVIEAEYCPVKKEFTGRVASYDIGFVFSIPDSNMVIFSTLGVREHK